MSALPGLFPVQAPPHPRHAILLGVDEGMLRTLGGQSLLDHALDRLLDAGIEQVVICAPSQTERVERHVRVRAALHPAAMNVVVSGQSDPDAVFAAAGNSLGVLEAPIFIVDGVNVWLDGPSPALERLSNGFDAHRLDALLLVSRTAYAIGDVGYGDFALDPDGLVRRRREQEVTPYAYAGVQIISPRVLAAAGSSALRIDRLWDRAITGRRLRALVHDGPWFHLAQPADLLAAESALCDPSFGPSNT